MAYSKESVEVQDFEKQLSSCLITKAPPALHYVPNFITEEEEEYLLRRVDTAPKPKWETLSNRRLQNWGGLPLEKGMIPEAIPNWLSIYMKKVSSLRLFGGHDANHCLVNEYLPGQGIMPHQDGSFFYPLVSTITLGSHCILNFYTHMDNISSSDSQVTSLEDRKFVSVLLERRSLILVSGDMYEKHLHGIEERLSDTLTSDVVNLDQTDLSIGTVLERGKRVSLTIRRVPKVLKGNLFGRK